MALVVNKLNNLRLDYLDHGWVKAIYHSEFLEFGDLPPEYETMIESLDLRSTFEDIIRSTDRWLSPETESNEEKSWATLSHLIQHKKVLAILAYYIDHGCKNVRTKEYRNNALLASRVYYKLLSIPGYKAYHIYHSQLFVHSLACLGFPKAMCDEESHLNTKELTREVNSVIKELRHFVIDLRAIIEHLQLGPSDMNFEDILSNLVDITGGAIVNKLHVDKIELTNMSGVIYEIIDILVCGATREPNAVAINLLFKCLLPKLVASSLDSRNANNLVKASYVTYSSLVLSKYGKAALSGYMVLLEHLCHNLEGLERAEVRNARVSLVVGLMSLLPPKSYRKIVKWLLRLSTTSKMSHRHIAMEMLATLLNNDPEPPENIPAIVAESNEQVNEPQASTSQTSDDQMATANQNAEQKKFVIATDDESSQDSQVPLLPEPDPDMTEEEIAGLLCQRPHTVPHAEILRAVYERVHDESSTLRTRAITILSDCVTSDRTPMINAIKELHGDGSASRLMAVAARSVCDERAAVRKAGAALLLRLLADRNAPPLQPTDLQILVNLCRDGSVLVRTAAIAAVGELVTLRPSDAVFDAFLSGPMHQLSDPENKVQEQVVSLIQQLLIDRLRKFTAPGCDEPLPWMILAAISRQKMDKHLQKACVMLSKSANSSINHRLVDIMSTHLGALDHARDLQCLILLTSVAKHVDYSDIAFALDYYYKLAESEEDRDARLMPLTLELITSWSRFMESHQRSTLRDYLVGRLAASRDNGCRINEAILAAHLDPDNITWATELMQLSERRALASGDVEEALRAADLSLVAPVPPSPALLTLFLRGVDDPPPEWDVARRGTCVVGSARLCVRSRGAAVSAAPALAALLARTHEPLPSRANALLALSDICVSAARHVRGGVRAAVRAVARRRRERRARAGRAAGAHARAAAVPGQRAAGAQRHMRQVYILCVTLSVGTGHTPQWDVARRGTCVVGSARLCVRSRGAAVSAAPALAALLARTHEPLPSRANALLALSDICVRYTCIVEPLLGIVCGCLSRESPALLRRSAARGLTRLLLGGYLRLRTPLYYRYCALLADEDHDVREPAEYYVTSCLTTDVIVKHFVDCVRHYNEVDTVHIPFDARQLIYDVMLQRMSLVQKLSIQCRLGKEVLETAVDLTDEGDEELSPEMNAAVLDTITLLCGPRMKLPKKPQTTGDLNDIEELQERVTSNVVSHKMKKMVAEDLVPAVIRLYTRLSPRGGQIAAYLVRLANDLFNDYKEEIRELIYHNEELMKRIQLFQETIGLEPTFGNVRNLVTKTAPPEPETPRASRRRPRLTAAAHSPRKRALPM